MKPIFLVGFMGSGKTTLGRNLAKTLGYEFLDIDIFIENRFHATVREIFNQNGEEEFRKIEHRVLHEIAEFENVIVACGGGTPCFFDNMSFMNSKGTTVYLKTSHERLMIRLTLPRAKAKRPLLASKTNEEIDIYVRNALEKREPIYGKALITFNSDKLENMAQLTESTTALIELIGKLPM